MSLFYKKNSPLDVRGRFGFNFVCSLQRVIAKTTVPPTERQSWPEDSLPWTRTSSMSWAPTINKWRYGNLGNIHN